VQAEAGVDAIIDAIDGDKRRADARDLIALMSRATGEQPRLWGNIIGFGRYHYQYESGHEGDSFLAGFASRKGKLSIYLMGSYLPDEEQHRETLLAQLGKHSMGKACLYVWRLEDIDRDVLTQLIERSVGALRKRYPHS
jgi:hypothetical protein